MSPAFLKRSLNSHLLAGVALVSLLSVGPVSAQATVEVPQTNTISPFGPFPLGGALIGQTFTAPAEYLNSWTVYLADAFYGDAVTFTANVGTWTGTTVGSVLWTSSFATGTNSLGFVPYAFNTGGLSLLTGGESYIFFLHAISGDGAMTLAVNDVNAYANGILMLSVGNDPAGSWGSFTPDFDMAFTAEFDRVAVESTVPEPATMTLLATGIAGIAAARRKRQRA